MIGYVVREPFGDFVKGQVVSDPAVIAQLEADAGHLHHLIRVNVADPAPAAPAAPAAPVNSASSQSSASSASTPGAV